MKLSLIAFMQPTVDTEVAPQRIEVASLSERFELAPAPLPPNGPGQPFGDAGQTSRLDAALGDPLGVTWVQRFATPLRADTRAHSLLQFGTALIVQASVWQLFGLDGKARRAGRSGSSPLLISPGDRSFRWVNSDGYLVSAPLSTGEAFWSYGLQLGDGASYPFVAARENRMFVLGGELAGNPEAHPRPATHFALQAIDLVPPFEVSPAGNLRSAHTLGALTVEFSGDVVGALNHDGVVIAWRDHVLTVGLDLVPGRLLTDSFVPRALSVGEAGRVYLVVRTSEGPRLWMLNAEGQRVFSAPLPDDAADTRVPPVVARDHRVFVVTDTRIVAFSPTGDRLWEFEPPHGRPRAMVTADGWLLVAAGETLGVFDAEGRSATLFHAPGEVFRTAPIVTPAGEIMVATERSLICIGPALEVFESTLIR